MAWSASESVVDAACTGLREHGYVVLTDAIDPAWVAQLRADLQQSALREAGIGRANSHQHNTAVRGDQIAWFERDNPVQALWLDFCHELQTELNRRLFLGLFSFECHYAQYRPGAAYARHRDSFLGQANRVLSLVTYLNADWSDDWGGELVIYDPQNDAQELVRVLPQQGTLVLFLSEEFPHEVRPASRDRQSIAGWFRVNTTDSNRVDPPR